MRSLSLAEDRLVTGASPTDVSLPGINPPPRVGIIVRPDPPRVPDPVNPPPHTGPVFPPAPTQ